MPSPPDDLPASARHQRIKQVFLDALDVPRGRRAGFLATACGGDDVLRRDVLELFLVHGEPDSVLDSPLDGSEALADLAQPREGHLGPYRLVRELGRGGMGVVNLAELDGRLVAVKLLAAGAVSPELRERFRLEAEILRRLDHPGIAHVLDVGESIGPGGVPQPWIAMEFVEGRPLLEYIEATALPLPSRLALLAAICDAVQHAHARGVVHRDLKPSNILVRADGRPVVLDFGVARLLAGEERPTELATRTGQLVGTPQYMSPEQVQAEPAGVGPASDVYSLGMVAYEVLAGRLPYEASSLSLHRAIVSILTLEPPPLGQASPELRGPIERIVSMALEKDPRHRYPDAGALGDDLRRRIEGRTVRARGASLVRRMVRWSAHRQMLTASVAILLVAGAVVGAWLLGGERTVPRERVRATYREAEMLIVQATPILYDGDRSPERLREVIDLLTRARVLLGQVPPLRHLPVLMRRLEKDLGTAEFLLGELAWDVRPARQAIVTLEHALSTPLDTLPGSLRDQQVAELGNAEISNEELSSLLAVAHLSLHRLWGRPHVLQRAIGHAQASLADLRRRWGRPRSPGELTDHEMIRHRFGYCFNSLAEVTTDLARFRGSAEIARRATVWSDSAYARRGSFAQDWPAFGSLLFERGRAYRTLGEQLGSVAWLDTAGRYLRASADYRGPDRPRVFAETREEAAGLELARARLDPDARSRTRRLLTALHDLDTARRVLAGTTAAPPLRAWYRMEEAVPCLELARSAGESAWLDSAEVRLRETSAAFSATSLPRQASFHRLRRGMLERARFDLLGGTANRESARDHLAYARSLAIARRDSLVLLPVGRERAALDSGERRRRLARGR